MPCWTNPCPKVSRGHRTEPSWKSQRQAALWSFGSDKSHGLMSVSWQSWTSSWSSSRHFDGGECHFSSLSGKGRAVRPNKFSILICERKIQSDKGNCPTVQGIRTRGVLTVAQVPSWIGELTSHPASLASWLKKKKRTLKTQSDNSVRYGSWGFLL